MYKLFAWTTNIYCILLLISCCSAISEHLVRGGVRSQIHILHDVSDEFQAEIPHPFVKVDKMYLHVDEETTVNWFGAVEKCRRLGGHLINLKSLEDLESLQNELKKNIDYWTDLNNLVDWKVFYSLTTGSKGNLLNPPSKVLNDNFCGLLHYNEAAKKFELGIQRCSLKKGRPICETTHPTTIQVLVY